MTRSADFLELYRSIRTRLFGFYDDCDEEHKITLELQDVRVR